MPSLKLARAMHLLLKISGEYKRTQHWLFNDLVEHDVHDTDIAIKPVNTSYPMGSGVWQDEAAYYHWVGLWAVYQPTHFPHVRYFESISDLVTQLSVLTRSELTQTKRLMLAHVRSLHLAWVEDWQRIWRRSLCLARRSLNHDTSSGRLFREYFDEWMEAGHTGATRKQTAASSECSGTPSKRLAEPR